MRRIPLVLVVCAFVGWQAATPSVAADSTKTQAASLCTLLAAMGNIVRDPVGLPSRPQGLVALFRNEYDEIIAEYGSYENASGHALALATGPMKRHLTKVFAADRWIFDALRAGHWTVQAWRRDEPLFAGRLEAIEPDLAAVLAYASKCEQDQGA